MLCLLGEFMSRFLENQDYFIDLGLDDLGLVLVYGLVYLIDFVLDSVIPVF